MKRYRSIRRKIKLYGIYAFLFLFMGYFSGYLPPPALKPNGADVLKFIKAHTQHTTLDPDFVYHIVLAESSLRPNAWTFYARGIMQISRAAWEQVSTESYRYAWNWRLNIDVGIKYLSFCETFLKKHNAFSHANLAAAYHYGLHNLAKKNFNARAFLPLEKNKIYRALLSS